MYKIKITFADEEDCEYSVADTKISYTKQPADLTTAEVGAVNQILGLMPAIRHAGITKVEVTMEA